MTRYTIEYLPREKDGTPIAKPHWLCEVLHHEPGYARLTCVERFATFGEAKRALAETRAHD